MAGFAHCYAVASERSVVLFTNNDSEYRTALHPKAVDLDVEAIVDSGDSCKADAGGVSVPVDFTLADLRSISARSRKWQNRRLICRLFLCFGFSENLCRGDQSHVAVEYLLGDAEETHNDLRAIVPIHGSLVDEALVGCEHAGIRRVLRNEKSDGVRFVGPHILSNFDQSLPHCSLTALLHPNDCRDRQHSILSCRFLTGAAGMRCRQVPSRERAATGSQTQLLLDCHVSRCVQYICRAVNDSGEALGRGGN
jgi:hypothetical protein